MLRAKILIFDEYGAKQPSSMKCMRKSNLKCSNNYIFKALLSVSDAIYNTI